MTCERCGYELQIGDYPFCKGRQSDHGPMGQAIETNESFIGGMTLENLGHDPVTVYSREEYKQAMIKANVEQHIKYVEGDHYLKDWSKSIDPKTLENARILVARCGRRS